MRASASVSSPATAARVVVVVVARPARRARPALEVPTSPRVARDDAALCPANKQTINQRVWITSGHAIEIEIARDGIARSVGRSVVSVVLFITVCEG